MFRIYHASDLPQAYLIKRLLEDEGVPSKILNENAQGGLGEIPFTHTYPEVWLLREADIFRAKRVLWKFENNSSTSDKTLTCSECKEINPGNFETCWNCGSELLDIPSDTP